MGGKFWVRRDRKKIAINADQWAGSPSCGTCADAWGNGNLCPLGIQGPILCLGQQHKAIRHKVLTIVTDEIWDKGYGDIDIGEQGDGRYPVNWRIVACPWSDDKERIALHSGGSIYYMKIQFRYLNS